MKVKEKLEIIHQQIAESCHKVNRDPSEIKIIAVTKYVTQERAMEALQAGVTNLGENRDDGLLNKHELLGDKPIWHFIGTLQTRKVKNIINIVEYIHSLDRLSLAEEINKRTKKEIKCLVQVNVSGEESKHGLDTKEVIPFIESLHSFQHLRIVGLMTMAPHTDDEEILRACFRNLRNLRDQIQALNYKFAPCEELSMGMSNDFAIAIEEGATMVRIGTALVGEED